MKKLRSKWGRWEWMIGIVLIISLYWWSIRGIPLVPIQKSAGQVSASILHGMFNPDWSYIYNGSGEDLVSQLVITLAIAFLGTFISAIISVPFSFLAAQTNSRWFHPRATIGKLLLTAIRAFPEVILAIMFIKAVGPGSFAGVLAVGFHSVGMLGKLFSESIEAMDHRAELAIKATGGTKLQRFWLATLPAILPAFFYRQPCIGLRSQSVLLPF